ncbi:pentalenene oxygenase [Nocardiopsis mwathae]|uniref:Pentalenene oxygenase n=2 Tax=Nocardiopsis mwathae TaxID=1472723 RepID=A0A7X0D847_9ACTN|nr:pentalenene oxygenase [Nocardiopsis mwathae]
MTAQIRETADSWKDGESIDLLHEMTAMAARIAAKTMFHSLLPPHLVEAAVADIGVIMRGIYKHTLAPWLSKLPTPEEHRYRRARHRLRHTIRHAIEHHRASRTDHADLLSILLATRDGLGDNTEQGHISDEHIEEQVLTFFLAGVEPTAATIAWALHLLAQHPHIEQRLHAEVDAVLAGRRPATYEDLPRLQLTRRIVVETLRLHPPPWMSTRTAVAHTRLGSHRIPAGTVLAFSPYLMHYDPQLYPDPHTFDPDRWADRRLPPLSPTFLPFGAGARKCIGDTFALTESALALSTITARWRLQHVPGRAVRSAVSAVASPRGPRMRLLARHARPPAAPPAHAQGL